MEVQGGAAPVDPGVAIPQLFHIKFRGKGPSSWQTVSKISLRTGPGETQQTKVEICTCKAITVIVCLIRNGLVSLISI